MYPPVVQAETVAVGESSAQVGVDLGRRGYDQVSRSAIEVLAVRSAAHPAVMHPAAMPRRDRGRPALDHANDLAEGQQFHIHGVAPAAAVTGELVAAEVVA